MTKVKVLSLLMVIAVVFGAIVMSTDSVSVKAREVNADSEVKVLSYSEKSLAEMSDDIGSGNGVIYVRDINDAKSGNLMKVATVSDETTANCDLHLGTYAYKANGKIKIGQLYGTQYTSETQLNSMVESVKQSLSVDGLQRSVVKNNLSNMEIGDSWQLMDSQRETGSLDYENENFGTYTEWYCTYKITTNRYRYFLYTFETYISPNNDPQYRANSIEYRASIDANSGLLVRDYSPKAKTPSGTVSVGSNLGGEISSDGLKVNANVSYSYSTLVESPKIFDSGNMAENFIDIKFEYNDPWANSGQKYDYNHNQSMQASIYIYREDINNRSIDTIRDQRDIVIVRDGFWPWQNMTFGVIRAKDHQPSKFR